METSRIVKFEGGEVVVRRLTIVDLISVWHSGKPEASMYVAALPDGFDLAALSMKDQLSILGAIVELNADLAKQLEEVAEDGIGSFRGGVEDREGARGAGGRPGRNLEDASGESAAPAPDGGSQSSTT